MNLKKYVSHILVACLSIAIATILWLTLFSRLGLESRHFYPPFWSYKAILSGSGKALIEDIGNIALFLPFGVFSSLYLRQDVKQSLLIGFSISLLIECTQWFFWLGSFEIDDLIHNTIGTAIGAFLVDRTAIGVQIQQEIKNRKKSICVLICLVALFVAIPLGYQGIKVQEMKWLAGMNDKNGMENLLVLSPDPKYIGQTDVHGGLIRTPEKHSGARTCSL